MATFLLLSIAGCGAGEQRGGYAVSTVKTSFYDDPTGFVVVFFGKKLNLDFELLGPERALLCIVYVGDSQYSNGYDATSMMHNRNVSTFSIRAGDTSFDVFWDRWDGSIKVDNEAFDLKDGNVVVLTKDGGRTQFNLGFEGSDVTLVIEAIADQEQAPAAFANWAANGPM